VNLSNYGSVYSAKTVLILAKPSVCWLNLTLSTVTISLDCSFKTVKFPCIHFLDLSRNVSISHRISDFFGIMEFNADGAMPKSSAVAHKVSQDLNHL
jgi:hypothetical protein